MLRDADYFRRDPHLASPADDHKEWQHFLVHAPGVELLVNFSAAAPTVAGGRPVARVIALAHTQDGWLGAVEQVDAEAPAGGLRARFGACSLDVDRDTYHLRFAVGELRGDLELRAAAIPALSHNIALTASRRLSWLMLPRLVARGGLELAGRRLTFAAAPAYHDHNWGQFRWGDDFAWEWGSGLPRDPACPWSLIFVRMSDRARHRARTQGLMLWRGGEHCRFFRDDELRVHASGTARIARVHKLPAIMALLAPGAHTDVPEQLTITATGGGDHLTLELRPDALTQVLIPDELRPRGVVVLNEALGDIQVAGQIRGERVEMEGSGVFEFLRG